ncbi:hypothetical protein QF038_004132 [Pseudarthrobacter sp. W1I19]|nr:hypothetical protein [Pseudarthrobacter sp. W1I19]
MERLPRVYQTMLELQMLEITKEPIEIAPTAHYSMGGVWVRPENHRTDVEGLYAIGEAASGLHGANRLGGNSLIELVVFGRIVRQAAATYSTTLETQYRSHAALSEARSEVDSLLRSHGKENVRELQRAVRDTMTEHAGVVRRIRFTRRSGGAGCDRGPSQKYRGSPRHCRRPRPSSRVRSQICFARRARHVRSCVGASRPGDATTAPTTPSKMTVYR